MFRLFNYGMSPLFSIVPFVTIFWKSLPAEWKCYVNKLQITKRNRTLPINLAALLFARRVRLSIQHETWSRTGDRISCEQVQPARRIRHGQTIGRDPCASRVAPRRPLPSSLAGDSVDFCSKFEVSSPALRKRAHALRILTPAH